MSGWGGRGRKISSNNGVRLPGNVGASCVMVGGLVAANTLVLRVVAALPQVIIPKTVGASPLVTTGRKVASTVAFEA